MGGKKGSDTTMMRVKIQKRINGVKQEQVIKTATTETGREITKGRKIGRKE